MRLGRSHGTPSLRTSTLCTSMATTSKEPACYNDISARSLWQKSSLFGSASKCANQPREDERISFRLILIRILRRQKKRSLRCINVRCSYLLLESAISEETVSRSVRPVKHGRGYITAKGAPQPGNLLSIYMMVPVPVGAVASPRPVLCTRSVLSYIH